MFSQHAATWQSICTPNLFTGFYVMMKTLIFSMIENVPDTSFHALCRSLHAMQFSWLVLIKNAAKSDA